MEIDNDDLKEDNNSDKFFDKLCKDLASDSDEDEYE
jgi:hypothetical protein